MERETNLETIFFPVELRPIGFVTSPSQKKLFPEAFPEDNVEHPDEAADTEFATLPQYKAVVRSDNQEVFAVVTNRYELLHNSRALALGKKAFAHLFPKASPEDFQVYDIRQTKTGSACHVDLIHKEWKKDVWEQETWLPYLRVANSYNKSKALTFDFGFVRDLCSNGIIFQKDTIQAKFYHTKGQLDLDLSQAPGFERLKNLEDEFADYMLQLKRAEVINDLLLPLCIYLLDLNFDLESDSAPHREREQKRLGDVKDSLQELLTNYTKELGSNSYAVLNAASDLATHEPAKAGSFASTAKLQETIGDRTRELIKELRTGGRDRLGELLETQRAWVA